MCATLLAWIEAGALDRNSLCIVHVVRDLDATVRSAMNFRVIQEYCDGTQPGVRAMIQRYSELARWHVAHLGLPTFELQYETLISQPEQAVNQLARFLGVDQPKRIRRAVKQIGRERGQRTFLLRRYLILGLRRLNRILGG
jgi:hypothetical protein